MGRHWGGEAPDPGGKGKPAFPGLFRKDACVSSLLCFLATHSLKQCNGIITGYFTQRLLHVPHSSEGSDSGFLASQGRRGARKK